MSASIVGVITSGQNAYATIHDLSDQVWNGAAFEAFNSANWATYAVTLIEQGSTGYYKGTFPGAIARGKYTFVVYVGSPPTHGDQAYDRGSIDWNGSTEDYLDLIIAKLPAGSISGFDPTTQNVNLNPNQSGVTIGTVNDLGASAQAEVKTQIDNSLGSDTIAELGGIPAATPTLKQAIMILFMALRNKRQSSTTAVNIYNSAGALITTAVQSDNGTVYVKEIFT